MGKWLVVLGTIFLGLVVWSAPAFAQERCPYTVSGEITAGDPVQAGRLKNSAPSTCAAPKTVPDLQAPVQPARFDSYMLKNRSATAVCVTVTVTPTGSSPLRSGAYLESFDPQNPQASYLGDSGNIEAAGQTYSFLVPALAKFVVTVNEVGNSGGTYDLSVNGCGSVVVTGVTPNAGPVAGGTGVTITGSGFLAGATVTVGGAAATGVNVANDSTIVATTPAGTAGPVSVVVTNPGGASSVLEDGFVYVAPAATTLTLASSINPAMVGQTVTFTAKAESGAGTPVGNVVFKDGTNTLGTAGLNNGTATFSTPALALGVHAITAVYAGNATFEPATSAVVSQVVTTAKTSTSMAVSANPTIVGNTIHFTVVVGPIPPATGVPTGTVTVSAEGTPVGPAVPLDANGRGTVTTSSLPVGTHAMVAAYSGDARFASSVSTPLSLRVDARVGGPDGGVLPAVDGGSSGGVADAGANEAAGEASGGGGCDCRTSGGSASSAGVLAFATLALVGLSRRRRRS